MAIIKSSFKWFALWEKENNFSVLMYLISLLPACDITSAWINRNPLWGSKQEYAAGMLIILYYIICSLRLREHCQRGGSQKEVHTLWENRTRVSLFMASKQNESFFLSVSLCKRTKRGLGLDSREKSEWIGNENWIPKIWKHRLAPPASCLSLLFSASLNALFFLNSRLLCTG